jgi:4-diphosphocytidyl-2-C-methyl-D-erythritol kinase
VLRSPAKLNLFLHITGRRPDGYHLLQSVFQLIDWCDTITLTDIPENEVRRINPIAGVPPEQDLVVRAAKLLKEFCKFDGGVEITLQKEIPMGAGLGGGSSDAATTLIGLNALWKLKLDKETLAKLGLQLGADVPFFIHGQNAFVEGIGEKIQGIELENRDILVILKMVWPILVKMSLLVACVKPLMRALIWINYLMSGKVFRARWPINIRLI